MGDPPFSEWIPPKPALAALSRAGPSNAISAIILRLKGGTIRAIAQTAATGEDEPERMVEVPRQGWNDAVDMSQHGPFWTLGDVEFDSGPYGDNTIFQGVRFHPEDVRHLIDQLGVGGLPGPFPKVASLTHRPDLPRIAPSASDLQVVAEIAAAVAGPNAAPVGTAVARPIPDDTSAPSARRPVSDATLTAWWAMCTTIKASEQWTVPEMEEFFRHCFPDKDVSRERIRKLRPTMKSGPKPRAAE